MNPSSGFVVGFRGSVVALEYKTILLNTLQRIKLIEYFDIKRLQETIFSLLLFFANFKH